MPPDGSAEVSGNVSLEFLESAVMGVSSSDEKEAILRPIDALNIVQLFRWLDENIQGSKCVTNSTLTISFTLFMKNLVPELLTHGVLEAV